eukprot:s659_g27.t1
MELARNTDSRFPMSRFEYGPITWRELEELTEERLWDTWAIPKTFHSLPPGQETRHRLNDKVLYMGDGTTSFKFTLVEHENLEHKPNWRMYQSVRTGEAFVVRPTGNPQGTLVFDFSWIREKKEVKITIPTSGTEIGKIPGRWGPRTVFSQVMDAFLSFCDLSTGNPRMILGSCQIAVGVGMRRVGPEMRKLTLEELFSDVEGARRLEREAEDSSDEDARLAAQLHRGPGLPRSIPHDTQRRPKQKVKSKMKKPASAAQMKKPARKS